MSLGLGDLKKKRRSAAPLKSAVKKTDVPIDWSARPRMARPWTEAGISRSNHRRRQPTDGVMYPEWMEACSSPVLSFDFFEENLLLKAQLELHELKSMAVEAVHDHVATARALLSLWLSRKIPYLDFK